MKKSLIRKYARTVAVVGGNVQKGQSVIVCVEPENEDFGVMLAEECYKAGAGCVAVEFYSNKVTKVDVRYRTLKSLKTVPKWGEAKAQQEVDDCAVRILVESDDPNALKGVNVAKMRSRAVSSGASARFLPKNGRKPFSRGTGRLPPSKSCGRRFWRRFTSPMTTTRWRRGRGGARISSAAAGF